MFNRYLIVIILGLACSPAAAALAAVPVPAHVDTEISPAPLSGPVLKLDYTGQPENDMRIADFLYFVALISPEPVTISESLTNTLRVRMAAIRQDSGEDRFSINLAFAVSGPGYRRGRQHAVRVHHDPTDRQGYDAELRQCRPESRCDVYLPFRREFEN